LSQGSKGRAKRKAEKRRLIRDEMVFIQGGAGFTLFDAKRYEEVMTVLYNAMTEMRKDTVKVRAVIGRTKSVTISSQKLKSTPQEILRAVSVTKSIGRLIKKEHFAVYLPAM